MAFNDEIVKQNYSPVYLFELDITQYQDFWTTWRAGCWYVNFDVYYPLIDVIFLIYPACCLT